MRVEFAFTINLLSGDKMAKFDAIEYKNRYSSENYDRITICLKKDEHIPDMIEKAMVKRRMQSRTEYIRQAIMEKLVRDGIDIEAERARYKAEEEREW